MSEKGKDYVLDVLYRLERATVNAVPLTELLTVDGGVLWQKFRSSVVDRDIRAFEKSRSYEVLTKETERVDRIHLGSVIIFIALFVQTCLASLYLLIRRQTVLVLSVDKVSDQVFKCDFRIRGIYEVLRSQSISFVECLHTTVHKSALRNAIARGRVALYIEAFDGLWYLYSFLVRRQRVPYTIANLTGTDDEIRFMSATIQNYLAAQDLYRFRTNAFTFLLQYTHIRVVVGIDDVRHYHELMEACRRLGICTMVVQHGHFTKYHVSFLKNDSVHTVRYPKAEKILVWSDYWKNELLRLGSVFADEEIVVAGYPQAKASVRFADALDDGVVRILVPYERDASAQAVAEFLTATTACRGIKVYLKLRADIPIDIQLAQYPEQVRAQITVVTDLEKMARPNGVMGVYSTFLYDMALVGVPLLRMDIGTGYGEGLVVNGLATSVRLASVCEDIHAGISIPTEVRAERAKKISSDVDFGKTLFRELKQAGV